MPLGFYLDSKRIDEVAQFLRDNAALIHSSLKSLPEVTCASELKRFGVRLRDVLGCLLLVAVGDWGLQRVRGGSTTLWERARDSVMGMTGGARGLSFEKLGEKLQAIAARRKSQRYKVNLAELGRILDTEEGVLDEIVGSVERGGIVDVNTLKRALKGLLAASKSEVPGSIPGKAAGLAARALHVVYGFSLKGGNVLYDVHVAKVTLRLGLIRPKMDGFEVVAASLFYHSGLRKSVISAWKRVGELSGFHPLVLDALLWSVGRKYCLFDDAIAPLSFRRSLCPAVRAKRRCPLEGVCAAARGDVNVVVFSRDVAGVETAVFNAGGCDGSGSGASGVGGVPP